MEEKIIELFERTMKNCNFYEKENQVAHLLNEIGVLRGIAYVMEEMKLCPHTEEFLYYINLQNVILDKMKNVKKG